LGGKSKVPSKFCAFHCDEASLSKPVVSTPEMKKFSTGNVNNIELPDFEDDTVLVGCKKAGNVNKFYDKTAGILALVRPCGIIANFTEMFTCESPTQAYIFIYNTFGRSLQDLQRLRYLGYDRSCDLHPFL
jgi:hypothetical protein